jgi:transcriptional regulator with XRE-family HTH domain
MELKNYIGELRTADKFRSAFAVATIAERAGEVLRHLRETARQSQSEIGRRLRLSQGRMSQIESGKVESIPSLSLMARYANACDDGIYLGSKSEHQALIKALEEKSAEIAKLKSDLTKADAEINRLKKGSYPHPVAMVALRQSPKLAKAMALAGVDVVFVNRRVTGCSVVATRSIATVEAGKKILRSLGLSRNVRSTSDVFQELTRIGFKDPQHKVFLGETE